ncbi:MAG: phospholipase D-like domain-containing protein [Flavobacterium sp.]|uniref:phospholipase D-like domain-containing protein n=1 Tax=Flavobacterium sp. TaxID=239 RepID=UPI003D0E3A5B
MRKRVKQKNGLEITAVIGTSAVLLSFEMEKSLTDGLLGFAIEREDHTENEKYYLKGFKYFEETAGNTFEGQLHSTFEHPVQSFLWEDFSVKCDHDYSYNVSPVYGKPKYLKYGNTCTIRFKTPTEDAGEHSVYFNRGVAGSLAYARKFKNKRPGSEDMTEEETAEALKWLSRGLEEALLKFIDKAQDSSYQLRAAFYEFEYLPVLEKFKIACEEKGVDVKIIYDSRGEEEANNKAINEAGLPRNVVIARSAEASKRFIAHNKFIILLKDEQPVEVWTGSTNITPKGIFGQCNVGHVIRNEDIAKQYFKYWTELAQDPLNDVLDKKTIAIQPDLTYDKIPKKSTKVFFSPREKKTILQTYADYMAGSKQLVCGMFPFSFSLKMKGVIVEKTDNLKYIIIDKKDKNTSLVTTDYDNVIVYGTYLKDGLYDWLEETHAGFLLNSKPTNIGTNFIHNKVLLIDPLSEDPIVVTGSANFSDNSIANNDENTLIIRGNKDVADLYFTEFYRIFNHYYARHTAVKMLENPSAENPIHLKTESAKWVPSFYNPNGLKYKRKKMFIDMKV